MSAVKLVTVFAENKLGQMARITQVLEPDGLHLLTQDELLRL